jgi:hypothetical protein
LCSCPQTLRVVALPVGWVGGIIHTQSAPPCQIHAAQISGSPVVRGHHKQTARVLQGRLLQEPTIGHTTAPTNLRVAARAVRNRLPQRRRQQPAHRETESTNSGSGVSTSRARARGSRAMMLPASQNTRA